MIEIKDPVLFFEIQSKFKRIAFSQSQGWYEYRKAQGKELAFFVDRMTDTNVMCWGMVERVPLIGKKILRIEGDVFSKVKENIIRDFYSGFKDSAYVGIEMDSNHNYSIEYEIGIRRAGFLRPFGSYSCPLSIEVDLSSELKFNRTWRKSLEKAINHNLHFKEITTPTSEDINTFIVIFKEMAGFKKMSFNLYHNSVSKLVNSDDFRFFIVSDEKGNRLSAHIVYVKNDFAYFTFAANSKLSRNYHAAHFMYKRILELLKLEQIKVFDHGRIPPSDKGTDGLYQFKKGTEGNKVQYNGEWTYYKSIITEIAVSLYKWLKLKNQRY